VAKTLIVGDPHLQIQRLEDNEVFLTKIMELARSHDRVLVLGDLFHTFGVIRSEILSQWNRFFVELGHKTICLVGNHDYAGQSGGNHAMEVFVGRGEIVDQNRTIDGVHYMPFVREREDFEARVRALPPGGVLVCHQSFAGVVFSTGYGDTEGASPSCAEHLSAVISGHVHTAQRIGNVWYPGTPYQMNFGEAGDTKRVYTVDLTKEGYQLIKEHDLELPCFVDIRTESVSQIVLPEAVSMNSYRFISKGIPVEIAAFWSREDVKNFRGRVRRVVDSIAPETGAAVIPGAVVGATKQERFKAFIFKRKWRTSPDRVAAAASTFVPNF
jgi:DNA repair exonuclease SbcCD nuclease subunit